MREFLARKSAFYREIDAFLCLRIFEKYKAHFAKKPIIHIVGTNGKGSTGRFLAQLLEGLNFKVGHYSSPHIFDFSERFYHAGRAASWEELEGAHRDLAALLGEDLESLSYFEYATFLAAILFEGCDFIIFEAGLGGEYDATSVFEKSLSIFTKIGRDHTQILGENLQQIARTKLKVMAKMTLISGEQEGEVLALAEKIALLKGTNLVVLGALEEDLEREVEKYSRAFGLPLFLQHNLKLALKSCELLGLKKESLGALKNLKALNLMGRCQKISEKLFIDVGHNEMAARALAQHFAGQKFRLVYNAYADKDIFAILKSLKPIVAKLALFVYEDEDRDLANEAVFGVCRALGMKCGPFEGGLEKDEKILVFGSFSLVERFLKEILSVEK
ncbi:Mur ligase family protein [Campylobacter sp.]|uniref:Mur ligase family protein n=1 Tax=Campylobacter sp. TaxID=205 RepID=UPI0026DB6A67|nr:Mur ligase family protein [Campylobacter sp.]MDO4674850.1 Mur ligase family protein [Campylobacter sp.]